MTSTPEDSAARRRPWTVEHAVLFASDQHALALAEARALKMMARCVAWGGLSLDRVLWSVGGKPEQESDEWVPWGDVRRVLEESLPPDSARGGGGLGAGARASGHVAPRGGRDDAGDGAVGARGEARHRARRRVSPVRRFRGRPFADLPNPLPPLLALEATGYEIDFIGPEAIRLVAPSSEERTALDRRRFEYHPPPT